MKLIRLLFLSALMYTQNAFSQEKQYLILNIAINNPTLLKKFVFPTADPSISSVTMKFLLNRGQSLNCYTNGSSVQTSNQGGCSISYYSTYINKNVLVKRESDFQYQITIDNEEFPLILKDSLVTQQIKTEHYLITAMFNYN